MTPKAEYRNRFLDPAVLGGIAHLDLVARTVVDGFISGLHRSPDFGFSQEFAEYRAYTPGDDLRHVDWNVFARTERAYLKRYRGDTNTQLTIVLDASASMAYGSGPVKKMDYARFLAASLCYMAHQQRDAAGLIVFQEDVSNYIPPSGRQGQLARLYHAIEEVHAIARTDFARPFLHFQRFLHRRGLVIVISDFYEEPERVIKAIHPLRARGNEVVLFHLLDAEELKPNLTGPVLLIDMETQDALEVSPEYARDEYRGKISAHVEALRSGARGAGLDYFLIETSRPLDGALREYLTIRQGRM
jgi:uncharacterized protein (DUF58 family)